MEELLFVLLRTALGLPEGGPAHKAVFYSLKNSDWEGLVYGAAMQQMGAIVCDEIISGGYGAPQNILEFCAAYSQRAQGLYDSRFSVLRRLSSVLGPEGVRIMTLKGHTIAACYPKPNLRECVDIDIFCFDDFEKVNELVISKGLSTLNEPLTDRHSSFVVDGVKVENHSSFVSECNQSTKVAERELMKLCKSCVHPSDPDIPYVCESCPQLGVLYLLVHSLTHLAWSGITLRHLCDITMYIRRHISEFDPEILRLSLSEARLDRSAALLLDMCNRRFGLGFDLSLWPPVDEGDEKKVLQGIFHPFKPSFRTRNPFAKLYRKAMAYRFRCTMHLIVYGVPFPDQFSKSLGFHRQ